ncbi:MAG: hypothetical protein ACKKMS_00160 [Candidatus Nealsonbacteria bacterium]
MEIQIIINEEDRTSDIALDSIQKEDLINETKDTLMFQVRKYGTKGFVPKVNEEVVMNIDGQIEFGGAIVSVEKSIQAGQMVVYDVVCSDYSLFLNRKLVLERFDNQTVNYIIDFIADKYAEGFTIINVNCPVEVKTMTFNRLTMSECLEKLAKAVGYSWYVDYDKDLHFFPKNENSAPFIVEDDNGKYLQDTLKITDDLSQIRNKVFIRGSEERATARTEIYVGDADQKIFPLANKFAEKPTVEVNDVEVDVGVDYLHKEEDYDCFWNFLQKYMRFKENMDGKKVEIIGIPLFPVLVAIPESVSIIKYGIYEFFKEEKSIASREEALKYAQAQLEAYKDGVMEGGFQTDTPGLRSGQIIRINSSLLGIDEEFLIQKVSFSAIAKDKGIWSVDLAMMRIVGIIQVLQDLIRAREIREFDPENLFTLLQLEDSCGATDSIEAPVVTTTKDYVWVGNSEPNPIIWNCWTWAD